MVGVAHRVGPVEAVTGDLVVVDGDVVDAELVDDRDADLRDIIDAWILAKDGSRNSGSPGVGPSNTERSYRRAIGQWLEFCARTGVHPMRARKVDVESWHRGLARTALPRTGRPPAKATLAHMVSVVASFYEFCVDEDYLEAVPVRSSTRPSAPKHSTTRGLSAVEAAKLRLAARDPEVASLRDRAIVEVLLGEGPRVAELAGLRIGSYGYNAGVRTLRVLGKGDKVREVRCSTAVVDALDAYLADRAAKDGVRVAQLDPDAPMFPSAAGGALSQQAVMRTVQRLAKAAGIADAHQLTPHVLRHTCVTLMLDAGVPIERVKEQVGHESITTTLRYDRSRTSLARSGVDTYAQYLDDVEAELVAAAASWA